MSPRPLLFVTLNFPPYRSSGFVRVRNYMEALPGLGFAPAFLVPELSAYPPDRIEPELVGLVPEATSVYRSRYRDPFGCLTALRRRLVGGPDPAPDRSAGASAGRRRPGSPWTAAKDLVHELLTTPDKRIGWLPGAIAAAAPAFARHRFEVVVSTGPPWTAHLIARHLRCRHRVAWVADFRDPWIGNPWNLDLDSAVRRFADRLLEASVVRRADLVVTTTPELAAAMGNRYPREPRGKFLAVANGIGRRERERLRARAPVDRKDGKLRILHTGTLYGGRDPAVLLGALAEIFATDPAAAEEIRVDFRGTFEYPDRSRSVLAENPAVANAVRFLPGVSRAAVLEEMRAADVLLLIQPAAGFQVPAKLFEYLALEKPVLALAGPGATANLLAGSGIAEPVDPEDALAVRSAVAGLLADWRADRMRDRRPPDPDRFLFDRQIAPLAGRLARIHLGLRADWGPE